MDSETKSKFEKQRNRLRELFNGIEIDGVEVKGPTKKDSLTIVKFKLTEKTAIKSVNQWLDIVGVIDRIIKQM